MATAHDTATRFPASATATVLETTTGDRTFSHAAAAGAAGVVVIVLGDLATPVVSGVLYGGTEMAKVAEATDTSEGGNVQVYFLNLGDLSLGGTQTVTLQGCAATGKVAYAHTCTSATGYTELDGIVQKNTTVAANPTADLATVANAMVYGGLMGGEGAPATYVPGAGEQVFTGGTGAGIGGDFGNNSGHVARSTAVTGAGTYTINWTDATSEDYCIAAISVKEIVPTHLGVATLAGVGTLDTTGNQIYSAAATLDGQGSVTIAGQVSKIGAATLSGVGTVTATTPATLFGAATLDGLGTLSVVGAVPKEGIATLAGIGSVTVAGSKTTGGVATLVGHGTLVSGSQIPRYGAATLVGAGTLYARTPQTRLGVATLVGAGTVTVGVQVSRLGASTLAGVGTLTGGSSVQRFAASILTGTSSLAATSQGLRFGAVILVGQGTVDVTGNYVAVEAFTLVGQGSVAVPGCVFKLGASTLVGAGTLATGSQVVRHVLVVLDSIGLVLVSGRVNKLGTPPPLVGVGTVNASGLREVLDALNLVGIGSVFVEGNRSHPVLGESTLVGVSDLSVAYDVYLPGEATLRGISTLSVSAQVLLAEDLVPFQSSKTYSVIRGRRPGSHIGSHIG